MYELNRHFRSLHPNLEICLLGHSMGALLAQQYTTRHGRTIDAMVLSGSPGFKDQQFSFIGQWLLKFEVWRLEPWEQSKLMQRALFGVLILPLMIPIRRDTNGYLVPRLLLSM